MFTDRPTRLSTASSLPFSYLFSMKCKPPIHLGLREECKRVSQRKYLYRKKLEDTNVTLLTHLHLLSKLNV